MVRPGAPRVAEEGPSAVLDCRADELAGRDSVEEVLYPDHGMTPGVTREGDGEYLEERYSGIPWPFEGV